MVALAAAHPIPTDGYNRISRPEQAGLCPRRAPRQLMRVMAVDHGEKRIGLAISDQTGTLARPLFVIKHVSREIDARKALDAATENGAELIIVGQSLDEEGRPNAAGRRAGRFVDALRAAGTIPIAMWDESMSTQDARATRLANGVGRKRRGSAIDAVAAEMILQSYLDAQEGSAAGPAAKERSV